MGFSFFGLFGQNNNFKIVALYCRSGNRSKTAARILADKGYEVIELGTGFRGWVAAGKDVMRP